MSFSFEDLEKLATRLETRAAVDAVPPAVTSPSASNHGFENEFEQATKIADVPSSWANNKALLELCRLESRFDPSAKNPLSSAFGLFQMLKAVWEEFVPEVPHGTEDPLYQIVGGMRYIQKVYKTPERALSFWRATMSRDENKAPEDLRWRVKKWIDKGYIGY